MRKIITSMIIILLSIVCMVNYSYAAEAQLEATIEITPNVTEVSAGDKVTFTFVTKNIVNAESGKIYAIGGKIVYDTSFFELDSTNGITLGDTGLFNSTNAVSEGGTNGTITLKVKDDATGSGNVEFTELEASDGRLEDMETLGTATTEDKTLTIKIKQSTGDGNGEQKPPVDEGNGNGEQKPPVDEGNGNGEQNPPTDEGNGTTVVVGDDKKDDKKDDTTAGKEYSKAGVNTLLIVGIVAVVIIAVVLYRKNKKYQGIN